MTLTLEVTGARAETLRERQKTFDEAGGTIGRAGTSPGRGKHWMLPDPMVSGEHARITFAEGEFYIEDRGSTNGTFIGSTENRLESRRPRLIRSGETVIIEPYRISVTVTGRAATIEPDVGPFSDVSSDLLDLLGPSRSGSKPAVHPQPEPVTPEPPPLFEPSPSPAAPSPGFIPPDWINREDSIIRPRPVVHPEPPVRPNEDSGPQRSAVTSGAAAPAVFPPTVEPPAPPPQVRAQAPMTADTLLASVLEGAGLRRDQVTPELAENLGKILRVVVAGVKDVLDARTQTKSEFGMDMTMLRPAENNPLKFSANVDDALHNLLVKRNPAFLGPVEAFEDAFDDLRHHQIAMLTALRVAFDAMLKQFDPEELQAEFDRQVKKSGGLSALAKWRYWELYRSKIHEMVQDADGCYRDLFGDEFARAYEEQLKRLKSPRRAPTR